MASAVTNTTTTVSQNSNTTASGNPKAQLQSQDFLMLLLQELEHQDPTSPMDTDKMLSQTSQLSALEAQNATKDAMTAMTTAFQSSAGYSMTAAIGKMATVGDGTVNLTDTGSTSFDFYLPTNATGVSVALTDSSGNLATTMSLGNQNAGTQTISWDGTDNTGKKLPAGAYKAKVYYYDTSGTAQTTTPGKLPVESVKFASGGTPQLKVGSQYYDMSQIQELSY